MLAVYKYKSSESSSEEGNVKVNPTGLPNFSAQSSNSHIPNTLQVHYLKPAAIQRTAGKRHAKPSLWPLTAQQGCHPVDPYRHSRNKEVDHLAKSDSRCEQPKLKIFYWEAKTLIKLHFNQKRKHTHTSNNQNHIHSFHSRPLFSCYELETATQNSPTSDLAHSAHLGKGIRGFFLTIQPHLWSSTFFKSATEYARRPSLLA